MTYVEKKIVDRIYCLNFKGKFKCYKISGKFQNAQTQDSKNNVEMGVNFDPKALEEKVESLRIAVLSRDPNQAFEHFFQVF